MKTSDSDLEFSRRKLLAAAGITAAASLVKSPPADAARRFEGPSESAFGPPVHGLHLQFGADASSEIVVSWHALQSVRRPRVALGYLDGRLERESVAEEVTYTDAKSGRVVYAYHARIEGLRPGTGYMYAAVHDGAEPDFGTIHTAPRGRMPFTFTSFADQGTPTLGKRYVPPSGVVLANPPFVNDNLGSPAAGDVALGVERVRPLFHLFNGDLCYANLAQDRVRTW